MVDESTVVDLAWDEHDFRETRAVHCCFTESTKEADIGIASSGRRDTGGFEVRRAEGRKKR